MNKRRNWLKTTIAMLTLVATVLETGFTSVSTLAAEFTNEDGIVVNNDAVEESTNENDEDLKIEVVSDDESDNEGSGDSEVVYKNDDEEEASSDVEETVDEPAATPDDVEETPAAAEDPDAELTTTGEEELKVETEPVEETVNEEAEELKEGKLELDDYGISGSGYDEISIYVDTDKLANKDTFRIEFSGPSGASYNQVLNDELDKTNDGYYDFKDLEGEDFTVRATSSSDLILSYRYNEDGYPAIYLESKPVDKVLETKTLSGNDDLQINGITGEGYESVTIEFDTEELSDRTSFKLYVDSDADATVDGRSAKDGIEGLSKDTRSLSIENLENEKFTAYIVSENDIKLETNVRVVSVDDGKVEFAIKVINTKREYVYEDDDVIVTATLENVDAIPDDAEFVVTKVTPQSRDYNYDAYLQAMNDNAEKITGEEEATISEGDVLFYDIAFYVTDENGNKVELQPEEGSVGINIGFKKQQLSEELEANEESEVKIIHLPLYDDVKENVDTTADATNITADDIAVEVVDSNTSVAGESATFELSDFSITAVLNQQGKMVPGKQVTFESVLGSAVNYGIVSNSAVFKGDMESNFAIYSASGYANFRGPKNDNGKSGRSLLGPYTLSDNQKSTVDKNGNSSEYVIYTVPGSKDYLQPNSGARVDTTTYSDGKIKSMVSNMVSSAKSMSAKLAAESAYHFTDYVTHPDTAHTKLDLKSKGSGAGTYYIEFKEGEFAEIKGKLVIVLGQGQNVVFNIPDDNVTITQFDAEIDGTSYTTNCNSGEDEVCRRIIWNAPNATETHTNKADGVFLFANSDFSVSEVSAGWVVADTISGIGGQEWHCIYHDIDTPTSVQFNARKTVSNVPATSEQKFWFGLYNSDESGNIGTQIGDLVQNNGEQIYFEPISYEADTITVNGGTKTFWYAIKEDLQGSDGYIIDSRVYVVKVVLKKVGSDLTVDSTEVFEKSQLSQKLEGDVEDSSNTPVVFDNTPEEDPTPEVFEYDIMAKKDIYVGDKKSDYHQEEVLENWPEGLTFKFKLEYEHEFQNDGYTTQSRKRLPGGVAGPIYREIKWNTPDKTVSFGKIQLDAKTVFEDALTNEYSYKNNYVTWGGAYPNQGDWNNARAFLKKAGLSDEQINKGTLHCTVYKYKVTEERDLTLPKGFTYGSGYTNPWGVSNEHFDRHIKLFVYTFTYDYRNYKVIDQKITCDEDKVQSTLQYNPKYVDENRYNGNPPCIVWDDRPLLFYNRYKKVNPEPEFTTIYGVKNYNGDASDLETFQFTISSEASGDAIADPRLAWRVNNNTTVSCGTDAQFNFGLMKYEHTDLNGGDSVKYHYIITEEGVSDEPDENGDYYLIAKPSVKVITKSIEFDVTVYDDGSGKLKISNPKASPVVEAPDFTNVYGADGSITFGVDKKFINESEIADLPTPKTFKFRLEGGLAEGEGHSWSEDREKGYVNEPIEITISEGTTEGSGTNNFTTIEYADLGAKGTYKYTITEEPPFPANATAEEKAKFLSSDGKYYVIDGIKYDARKYNITVTLKDNNNGQLVPEKVIAGYEGEEEEKDSPENIKVLTAEFKNKYDLKPVEDYVYGQKILVGDKDLTNEKFTFVLEPEETYTDDEISYNPNEMTVKNGVMDGKASSYFEFGKITFKKERSTPYKFKITESEEAGVDLTGMNLGDKEDEERNKYGFDHGVQHVEFTVTKVGGKLQVTNNMPKSGVAFRNTYGSGKIHLYAKKKFYAPEGIAQSLSQNFTFRLENVTGDGFGTDTKNFKNFTNGVLDTPDAGYSVEVLDPDDWNDGFEVTPVEGLKYDQSMLNKVDGKSVKTQFKYRISEVISETIASKLASDGSYNGFKYALDPAIDTNGFASAQPLQRESYEVIVTVDPQEDGKLNVSTDSFSADNKGETLVKFLNSYVPAPSDLSIIGKKYIDRPEGFIAGECGDKFKIRLTDPAGNTKDVDVEFTAGKSDGSFSFTGITVNRTILSKWPEYNGQDDKYLFTVTELPGGWATTADGTRDGKKISAGVNDKHTTFYVLVTIKEEKGGFTISKTIYSDKSLDPEFEIGTEGKDGNIEIPLIEYNNKYTKPGTAEIKATKYYTGSFGDNDFTFYLKDKDTATEGNKNMLTVGNKGQSVNNVTFDKIEYGFDGSARATTTDGSVVEFATKANFDTIEDGTYQTYKYTIVEKVDLDKKYTLDKDGNYVKGYIRYYGVPDYDPDNTEYKDVFDVTVKVREVQKEENGKKVMTLEVADPEYWDLVKNESAPNGAAINNERVLNTSVKIPVTKVFDSPADMPKKTFEFKLKGTKYVDGEQKKFEATRYITVGGGESGKAEFDPDDENYSDLDMLKFTQDDLDSQASELIDGKYVKHFFMEEVHPDDAIAITTTIEAEDADGKKVTRTIPAFFKDGVIYDGRTFNVDVKLWIDEKKPGEIQSDWVAYDPDSEEAPQTNSEKYADSFFKGLIHKVWSSIKGIFGVLDDEQNIRFVNIYKSKGELKLSAKKIMEILPAEKKLEDYKFKFILIGKDEDNKDIAPAEGVEVKLTEDGYIADFGTITYTKTGEYEYRIREFIPENVPSTTDEQGRVVINGVHYDKNVYVIKVKVEQNDPKSGNGRLNVSAVVTIDGVEGVVDSPVSSVETITTDGKVTYDYKPCEYQADFNNIYEATPVEVQLSGIKKVNGGSTLNAGDFTFALCDENGKALGNEYVVTNDANGRFEFPNLEYKLNDEWIVAESGADGLTTTSYAKDKEFKYVIREYTTEEELKAANNKKIPNTIYDTHEVNVTVKVHNENGALSAIVETNDPKGSSIEDQFDNEGNLILVSRKVAEFYNPQMMPDKEKFAVTKVVEGTSETDKEFTFKIEGDIPSDWAAEGKDTVTLHAGETKEFPEIEYKFDDIKDYKNTDGTYSRTYTYTVSEIQKTNDSDDAYEYSKDVYKAEVVISSDGDSSKLGKKTTVTLNGDAYTGTDMVFKNKFKAVGWTHVDGVKTMINKSIDKDEFTYSIVDADDPAAKEYTVKSKGKSLDRGTMTAVEKFSFTGDPNAENSIAILKFDQETLKKDNVIQKSVTKHYVVREKDPSGVIEPDKLENGPIDEDETITRYHGVHYAEDVYDVYVTVYDNDKENGHAAKWDDEAKVWKLDVSEPVIYRRSDPEVAVGPENKPASSGSSVNTKNSIYKFFKDLLDKIRNDGSDGTDKEITFVNDYNAKCVIDPPILKKYMMGKNIQRGEFSFHITGPSLKSTDNKEYESTVRNGLNPALDDPTMGVGKWPEGADYDHDQKYIKDEGEIYVSDITYYFNDLEWSEAHHRFEKEVEYFAEEINEDENYSRAKFRLKFVVFDKGDGTLDTDPTLETMKKQGWEWIPGTGNGFKKDGFDFINIKNHEASINLSGEKKLEGRNFNENDKFVFTLTDKANPSNVASVTVTGDKYNKTSVMPVEFKDVDFLKYKYGLFKDGGEKIDEDDKMKSEGGLLEDYDDVGTYVYTIKEEQINQNGITCDTKEYEVTVKVELVDVDPATGEQKLEARVVKDEWNNPDRPEVSPKPYGYGIKVRDTNTYDAFQFINKFGATTKIDLEGKKYVHDETGADLSSTETLLNQFKFALYKYNDADRKYGKELVSEAYCGADGSFKLDIPKYTSDLLRKENGEYEDTKTLYYRIVETKPSIGKWNGTVFESRGVIYDNSEYDVDVTLTLDKAKGELSVAKDIKEAATGTKVDKITYTNIYKRHKIVEGEKFWIDRGDPRNHPEITVELYSSAVNNGNTVINTTKIPNGRTTYRFTTDSAGKELPYFDENGNTILYSVKEADSYGYLSEIDGFDIINTDGDILIRKIDAETGSTLSGATLAILDGSTEIERWVSGRSAHVVQTKLTNGKTYTLHEIAAPEGYELAPDQTFTVPSNGESITVTMEDRPILGSVRLTKRDAATRETLSGAQFALYTEGGARVFATGSAGSYTVTDRTSNGVFEVDGSGSLTIADLPYGTYYFEETRAPEGYTLSRERLGFTVLRTGELVEVTYYNTKAVGSVRLRKVDPTGRTLSGAVFELYAATPRTVGMAATATIFTDAYYRVGTYRTNSAGEIYVTDLPWDDYYFIEVDAPSGYEVRTDITGEDLVYTFRISAATADRTIDLGGIINERPPEYPPEEPGPTPTPTTPRGGVLGERVAKGGVVNGVLGVRAKPNSGVLGERVGPVTGDTSNIILWLLLFAACVATIVATIVTGKKKKTGAK